MCLSGSFDIQGFLFAGKLDDRMFWGLKKSFWFDKGLFFKTLSKVKKNNGQENQYVFILRVSSDKCLISVKTWFSKPCKLNKMLVEDSHGAQRLRCDRSVSLWQIISRKVFQLIGQLATFSLLKSLDFN